MTAEAPAPRHGCQESTSVGHVIEWDQRYRRWYLDPEVLPSPAIVFCPYCGLKLPTEEEVGDLPPFAAAPDEGKPVDPGPVAPSTEARRLLAVFAPWLREPARSGGDR